MGEIKSTMDLVMARTRHMKMTDAEKQARRLSEFSGKVRGVIQKYQDGIMALDETLGKIGELARDLGTDSYETVVSAVLGRMDPEGDNEILVELLLRLDSEKGRTAEALLSEHAEAMKRLAEAGTARILERLETDYGIAGSAVIPNPKADSRWRDAAGRRIEALRERLSALMPARTDQSI